MSIERLSVLIGHWNISGRGVGANQDNITGHVAVERILDGRLLRLSGTMRVDELEIESLELVWADPTTGELVAHVYADGGPPVDYRWERRGQTLIHAGSGATYTGTISDDGATIAGGWRPDPGQPAHPGAAYDTVMRRVAAAGGPVGPRTSQPSEFGFYPHHVQLAIPPGSEESCRDFYVDVLGMTEIQKPPVLAARGGLWVRADRLEIHLGVEEDFRPARKAHPGIVVEDLDGLAKRLADNGVEITWDENFPGYRRFHTFDTLGNRLEFLSPERS